MMTYEKYLEKATYNARRNMVIAAFTWFIFLGLSIVGTAIFCGVIVHNAPGIELSLVYSAITLGIGLLAFPYLFFKVVVAVTSYITDYQNELLANKWRKEVLKKAQDEKDAQDLKDAFVAFGKAMINHIREDNNWYRKTDDQIMKDIDKETDRVRDEIMKPIEKENEEILSKW